MYSNSARDQIGVPISKGSYWDYYLIRQFPIDETRRFLIITVSSRGFLCTEGFTWLRISNKGTPISGTKGLKVNGS